MNGDRAIHTLMMIVGGLVGLGIFMLAAVLLGRRAADGARVFILPWLVVALVNMAVGVYWANIPVSAELPILVIVFGIPAGVAWLLTRRFGLKA
jgi:hypothetical protein